MGKGMGGHQSANRKTDEWLTPREIITSLGCFDLDPCSPINRPWPTAANHFTIEDNGLMKKWFGRVWLNPPYSNLEPWMRLISEHGNGIALIFARTDRMEFHRYVFPVADSLFFIKRRIIFCNTAGFKAEFDGGAPSVFIAYGEQNSQALAQSGFKGHHVPINYTPIMIVGISPTWLSVTTIAVKRCGDEELKPIYEMVERIAPDKIAGNRHWKEKIRQQMQIIRKKQKTTTFTIDV